MFTQVGSPTVRSHEGLGVGLFLARRIMQAHGGRLDVRDRDGGGTTFVLGYPVADVSWGRSRRADLDL